MGFGYISPHVCFDSTEVSFTGCSKAKSSEKAPINIKMDSSIQMAIAEASSTRTNH